ncbi:MAG: hypothetical protein K2H30_00005 [Clostridia bacterium]|nr:hypothetical protein [Clostridia bacterium]
MEKCKFSGMEKVNFTKEFFECGTCGNHVCKTKAELWGRVCPHCFGVLYRIS